MNMNKEELTITFPFGNKSVKVEITIVPEKNPLIAFVQLDFGFIKVKGCTVKWKDFGKGGEPVLVFDLPAYKTAFKYIKAVYFPESEHYKTLTSAILNKIQERLAVNADPDSEEPELDLEDIPF